MMDIKPYGHFQINEGWGTTDEVQDEYAGQEGVFPLYDAATVQRLEEIRIAQETRLGQLEQEATALRALLDESRANDRAAMGYLNSIRAALSFDGDFPSLVEHCAQLAQQEPVAMLDDERGVGVIFWLVSPATIPKGARFYLSPALQADEKEAPKWLPISTAPADGKCLVLVDTDDGPYICRLDRDRDGNWIHDGEPTFCHGYLFRPILWSPFPDLPAEDAIEAAKEGA